MERFKSWSRLKASGTRANALTLSRSRRRTTRIAKLPVLHCQAGLHVVCDKPMTTNMADAEKMVATVERCGRVFALTHNYSGYPMMRQAREMIAAGELGDLIAVRATYVQGWMQGMQPGVEAERGVWKADPTKNGRAGSLGDVGTHAFHLMRFVTGLKPDSLLSRMSSYSDHHQLDDYGHAIIRFDRGATGLVTWSQVSHGRLNDLSIEIDGTRAALSWRQEQPNQLFVRSLGQPTRIYERNPKADYSTSTAVAACRLPGGHPEAFFEAFANVYRDAFADMRRSNRGEPLDLHRHRCIQMFMTVSTVFVSWSVVLKATITTRRGVNGDIRDVMHRPVPRGSRRRQPLRCLCFVLGTNCLVHVPGPLRLAVPVLLPWEAFSVPASSRLRRGDRSSGGSGRIRSMASFGPFASRTTATRPGDPGPLCRTSRCESLAR